MSSPFLAWSPLVLAAGLFLPTSAPANQGAKWKPLFDYTNLPPTNEEYWEPLVHASVPMEAAIKLAEEGEKASVRVLHGELRPGPEGAAWHLELFVGDGDAVKRVNVIVSTSEPKILHRTELRAIAADEMELWPALSAVKVPAEDSIEVAKKTAIGNKPTPVVHDPRVRTLRITVDHGVSLWDIELMALDRKQSRPRRYEIGVNTAAARFKHMVLLDRFPGTPLRRGQPTDGEQGLVLFDFHTGQGDPITADSTVKVDYRLWLLDQTKIRDTLKTKLPETFKVSEAPLEGMRLGMVGMQVGGRRKICMPYPLAFGEKGTELSPPKAMVVCDIWVEQLIGPDGKPITPEQPPKEDDPDEDEDK